MKRKICFRADANSQIGYGHFIRTLALADMLKDDFECVFYTSDPSFYQIEEMKRVCSYVPLYENTKIEDFIAFLDGSEIVVLDNYFFTTDYQKVLKTKGCTLVCIDDMHDKHYMADVVINHGNVKPDVFDKEPYTRLCLGDQWKLLRRPFLIKPRNIKRNNTAVICLGGADPCHLTDKLVSMALQVANQYHILVILGDKTILSEENRARVEVRRCLTAEQIAELFETSAFAILPSSTVSIEAASRGVPMLIGFQADNQVEGYNKKADNGSFIPLGDLRQLDSRILGTAISKLDIFKPAVPDFSLVPQNYIHLFNSLC